MTGPDDLPAAGDLTATTISRPDEAPEIRIPRPLIGGVDMEAIIASARTLKADAFAPAPPHVGGYAVNGFVFLRMVRRPSWWHRWWTRVLLGWAWVD